MSDLLFDRKLLRVNQGRFSDQFHDHNFLHHEIAQIMADNILAMNRDFSDMVEISAKDNFLTNYITDNKKVKRKITSSLNSANFSDVVFDDEEIPFKKESLDLVVSNLNMQHINKIPQFLMQVNASLKENGVFMASFFGEENLLDLKKATFEAESEILGGVSPRFIPVIDIQMAANLLAKAGFKDPISTLEKIDVTYERSMNILRDLKYMGQGNILNLKSRKFATAKFLDEILNKYAKIADNDDSGVNVRYEVIIVIGWKRNKK